MDGGRECEPRGQVDESNVVLLLPVVQGILDVSLGGHPDACAPLGCCPLVDGTHFDEKTTRGANPAEAVRRGEDHAGRDDGAGAHEGGFVIDV